MNKNLIQISRGYPPVINDKKVVGIIRDMILKQPEEYHLKESEYPSLGGEDFSFFLEKTPGCFMRIGARPTHQAPAPAHSPGFDFSENALMPGAALFARAALAITASLKHTRVEDKASAKAHRHGGEKNDHE